MAHNVCLKLLHLMYISPYNISIWKLNIELPKLTRWEDEYLTIQQIVSHVFHQTDSVKEEVCRFE